MPSRITRTTADFSVDLISLVLGTLAALVVFGAITPEGLDRPDRILTGLVTMALVHGNSMSFKLSMADVPSRTVLVWLALALPLGLLQVAACFWGVLTLLF